MIQRIVTIMLALLLTAGCASRNDWKINEGYEQSVQNHQVEQTLQIRHKVQAIKDTMIYECNDGTEACGVAKAMSQMVAAGHIATVKSEPYRGTRPTTGVDVQKNMASFTGQAITGAMTFGIVRVVSDNQPTTEYNNNGDVKGSGNRSEAHSTAIGDSNQGLDSGSTLDGKQDEEYEEGNITIPEE